MSKPVSTNKSEKTAKSAAAFANKESGKFPASKTNPSKYAAGKDSDLTFQNLDPEDGLVKLFTDCIRDLYWAENQLVNALPRMAAAADFADLKNAILTHLDQTKTHVVRLEQVFHILGEKIQAQKCDAMEGLTKEGEGVIEQTDANTPARDLGIIMASQKVEHYEIAAYTGLISLAVKLNMPEIADLLSLTLAEEQDSDQLLADLGDQLLQ